MPLAIKKYNLKGDAVGEVSCDEKSFSSEAHPQMVKDYIVAIRANMRQWSACTKGRSEVSHSTKKPHPQKGTGGARQGSLAAPQYRGGGVVFGPKPKFDQHVRINKKERRKAIAFLLLQKIKAHNVLLLEDKVINDELKKPQTKTMAQFLKKHGVIGRKILFLGGEKNFKLSARNIPHASFVSANNISGYDLLASRYLVMSESSFNELTKMVKQ